MRRAELDRLAAGLAEAAAEAARLGRAVTDGWWDERGREVAASLARVGRELDVQADRAARAADDLLSGLTDPDTDAPPGVRLPTVGGRGETERRGMRLPALDEPDPPAR